MTDHYMAYQQSQLKQAGVGSTTTAEDIDAHMADHRAQTEALGNWANPNNDPNDLVAGVLEGAVGAFRQMKTETGGQNLAAAQPYGPAIQATAANFDEAEDANSGMVQQI
ncbi:hypothetical protein GCM10027176_80070 [Actinoallomurus bryophytorum]|uniref:Uncharacterized protein n=1 Tax=Actinoallomurus bryophytorum TaxID=1490222 RepID=A0A543CR25_9ACTN|nr:hypothetical protein [Actinoallomurus bryophytorum]TQL99563.1 hypothetical protein FB559_5255 [Actinoallomurus bryophytorum]